MPFRKEVLSQKVEKTKKGKAKQNLVEFSSEDEEEEKQETGKVPSDQLEKTMKKLFQDFKREIKKEMKDFHESLTFYKIQRKRRCVQ